MSDRQVAIWETGSLANIKTTTIDQSSGVLMPFWTDNNILFLGTSLAFNLRAICAQHLPSIAGKG